MADKTADRASPLANHKRFAAIQQPLFLVVRTSGRKEKRLLFFRR